MDNPLYMRHVYERIEHYLANAIGNRGFDNFERFEGKLLVDNLGKLNYRFELPKQLGPDSTFGVTINTTATGFYDAHSPEARLKTLEETITGLRALLAKKSDLDKKGYDGTYYESDSHPLDEMGFKYNIPATTPDDLERVIDDFIAENPDS